MIYSEDAPALEKSLHRHFELMQVNRVNPRKEFFRVSLQAIKEKIGALGIEEIHWTMRAEAAEFRESQAMVKEAERMAAIQAVVN